MRHANRFHALLLALSIAPGTSQAQERTLQGTQEAKKQPGLVVERAPRELAAGAVVRDWPSFRGPRRDGVCSEAPLAAKFGAEGPPLVWAMERGQGFASPAVGEGRLVFTHREGDQAHVDSLDPATGRRHWRQSIPCTYSGRYFSNGGPRATPTIADGKVVVQDVGGVLACFDLATGEPLWQLDTVEGMGAREGFFGVVSTPLVVGDAVIQNVGAAGGPTVAAFDLATGEPRWGAGETWGASCASPVLARLAGEDRILVMTGGVSRPPTGGLVIVSPDGELTFEYPFRSRTYESVNGSSPVACGDTVFLTSSYGVGAAAIDVDAKGGGTERWKDRRGLALEFSTPVFVDGLVFAIDGVSGRGGAILAIDPATGEERARRPFSFEQVLGSGEGARRVDAGVGKGSLVHADGHFWILGDTGQLVVVRFDGESFEIVSQAPLFFAQQTWTPPVISGGLLYVCQNNRSRGDGAPARLLCYDVRGASPAKGDR
ncbi:MAG: PQQ-binding-like beta-propeller repeat protein [Planctomycetota bacterium]